MKETFLDKYDGTSWMVEEEEDIDGSGVEVFTFLMGLIFIVKSLVEVLILELLMIVFSSKQVQMSYSD